MLNDKYMLDVFSIKDICELNNPKIISMIIDYEDEMRGLGGSLKKSDLIINKYKKYIFDDMHEMYVGFYDNEAVGFVAIYKNEKKHRYVISETYVVSQYRRNGVGTELVDKLLKEFKGAWRVEIHPQNYKAKIFWGSVIKNNTFREEKVVNEVGRTYEDGSYVINIFFDNQDF